MKRIKTEFKAIMLNDFFNKYPFKEIKQSHSIDYDFFENIIPKAICAKSERSVTPPSLNIFEGFNLGENELKHCSMLSWFFNPNANHCQGELFFNKFLEKYNIEGVKEFSNGGYFNVKTEDNFSSNGRVDIIISSNHFCFIIEAKIFASDQDHQIERYNNILNQKSEIFGIPQDRCKLFYLTIDGKEPSSGKVDFCITWKEISAILNNFSDSCKNEYVSLTALQYANYIHKHL